MALIIAHRGASRQKRGNTLPAFKRAITLGCDMIELDVHKTGDGKLIVHHDNHIDDEKISRMTYSQISDLRPHVPLLDDVITLARDKIRLDVEIKPRGIELTVVEALLKRLEPHQFVVTSFHDSSIYRIKKKRPQVKAGLLLGTSEPQRFFLTRMTELFPERRVIKCLADFAVPHWALLHFDFIHRMKMHGIPVYIWTINSSRRIDQFLRKGNVAGVITDRPQLALKIRNKIRPGFNPSSSSNRAGEGQDAA